MDKSVFEQLRLLQKLHQELAHLSDVMTMLLDEEVEKDINMGKSKALRLKELTVETLNKAKRSD
jgi:hypothetical protein